MVWSRKPRGTPRRVLIVDDNEDFAVSLQALLESVQWQVDIARSGWRALHLAATHQFDAVILDIRLPDLSGYTLVRELRMKPAYACVTIVGLTGSFPAGASPTPIEIGFYRFFLKPIDFDLLKSALEPKQVAANRVSANATAPSSGRLADE